MSDNQYQNSYQNNQNNQNAQSSYNQSSYNQNYNSQYTNQQYNGVPNQGYQQNPQYRAPSNQKPGPAITCMILGICSVSMWWVPFFTSIPCIVLGIVALVLAGKHKARLPRCKGFFVAGTVTGIIGIVLSSIYTIICLAAASQLGSLGRYYRYWY